MGGEVDLGGGLSNLGDGLMGASGAFKKIATNETGVMEGLGDAKDVQGAIQGQGLTADLAQIRELTNQIIRIFDGMDDKHESMQRIVAADTIDADETRSLIHEVVGLDTHAHVEIRNAADRVVARTEEADVTLGTHLGRAILHRRAVFADALENLGELDTAISQSTAAVSEVSAEADKAAALTETYGKQVKRSSSK